MHIRQLLVFLLMPCLVLVADGCRRRGQKKPTKTKDYNTRLAPGEQALVEVDTAELPPLVLTPATREQLKAGIGYSLAWFAKPSSERPFPVSGIDKDQVVRSLNLLLDLLGSTTTDAELNQAIRSRFRALMSVGCDGQGTVLFTGYYTPIFSASLKPDATYKYPLYKKPADLVPGVGDTPARRSLPDGSMVPYPSRGELEASGVLRGTELVWLSDPFECYVIQVQGSAKLRMTSGELMEVGYDGTNNLPYHAIAKDMVEEGKMKPEELSLATMRAYFKQHPEDLPAYTARNPRFVFFTQTKGGPFGSLGQKVTANVTVATDKSIFPPGAPLLVKTRTTSEAGIQNDYAALRLDQDTGGAIRAPGRCDLFMGEGDGAERRAGSQLAEGKLYYLIIKD